VNCYLAQRAAVVTIPSGTNTKLGDRTSTIIIVIPTGGGVFDACTFYQ